MSGVSAGEIAEIIHTIEDLVGTVSQDVEKALIKLEHELEHDIKCFTTGTMIRTAGGDVAVEDLRVGDMVLTAAGAQRPIKWLGHRKVDCARHPDRQWALPIKIAKGAIDGLRPERDLLVSPGHTLCLNVIEEILVPAYALLNGATVTQLDVPEITYWHIELETHDVLVANGMPAESYFETGNRAFFVESQTVALDSLPDAPVKAAGSDPFEGYCRPFVDAGPVIDGIRDRMRQRALALGWTQAETVSADMHLVVDGVRLDPDSRELLNRFVLPATAKDVWLVSDTYVPYHVAHQDDRRVLGVSLGRVTVDDGLGQPRLVDLDDPLLSEGFHAPQAGPHRWTDGRARLPAELWKDCRGSFFLRIDLAMTGGRRWVAPAAKSEAALRLAA